MLEKLQSLHPTTNAEVLERIARLTENKKIIAWENTDKGLTLFLEGGDALCITALNTPSGGALVISWRGEKIGAII